MATSINYIEGTKQLIILILLIASTIVSWHYAIALVSRVRPTFYLNEIHVSSLNNPLDSTRIYFDLKIENENNLVGLYYDDPLTLTFTYFPPTSSTTKTPKVAQAKYRIGGFYQGNGKVKDVQDFVVVQDFFPDDRREIEETSGGSWTGPVKVTDLRVDLDGKLNFKSIENKEIDLIAGVTVEMNSETGLIVQNQTIKLDYASGSDSWGFLQWLMFFGLLILFNSVCSAVFSWHAPSFISRTIA